MPITTTKRQTAKSDATDGPRAELRPLIDRITALEREVAELKASKYATEKPYMRSFGNVPDDEITRDAERLGRAWRTRQK